MINPQHVYEGYISQFVSTQDFEGSYILTGNRGMNLRKLL